MADADRAASIKVRLDCTRAMSNFQLTQMTARVALTGGSSVCMHMTPVVEWRKAHCS